MRCSMGFPHDRRMRCARCDMYTILLSTLTTCASNTQCMLIMPSHAEKFPTSSSARCPRQLIDMLESTCTWIGSGNFQRQLRSTFARVVDDLEGILPAVNSARQHRSENGYWLQHDRCWTVVDQRQQVLRQSRI